MKLVASMVVRNELGRYLEPVVAHLLNFCDEVRVVDDGSDDGTLKWLSGRTGVFLYGFAETEFFAHEGRLRQHLLEWTLQAEPTHVLAIDADEFVADGDLVRRMVEDHPEAPAFSLCMTEVWRATEKTFLVRCDGSWGPHRAPILWKVSSGAPGGIRIADSPAASGRIPTFVPSLHRQIVATDVEILHFGWANESGRAARHARYADAGSFGHNPNHIASILYPDERVGLEAREWPDGLSGLVGEIVKRSNPVPA